MVRSIAFAGGELRLAGADRHRTGEASLLSDSQSGASLFAECYAKTDTESAGEHSAFQWRIPGSDAIDELCRDEPRRQRSSRPYCDSSRDCFQPGLRSARREL